MPGPAARQPDHQRLDESIVSTDDVKSQSLPSSDSDELGVGQTP